MKVVKASCYIPFFFIITTHQSCVADRAMIVYRNSPKCTHNTYKFVKREREEWNTLKIQMAGEEEGQITTYNTRNDASFLITQIPGSLSMKP